MRGSRVGRFLQRTFSTSAAVMAVAVIGLSLSPVTAFEDSGQSVSASTIDASNVTVFAKTSPIATRDRDQMRAAISTFVWGLSNEKPDVVWFFAPEAEQAAFQTQEAAFAFFARNHTPLIHARQITFDGISMKDGAPVASVYIQDELGIQWRALFELAQDFDGGWKITDCSIDAAPGELI